MASVLKVDRGTTYSITLNYQRDSVPADLSRATVRFTVKKVESDGSATDSTALIIKNVTVHPDPTHGVSQVDLAPADTATIDPGKYHYDLKVDEQSDGTHVYKVDEGVFQLDGSPTNRLV